MKKKLKIFHCSRKHLFVLHHAKFHGNIPKNHKVTAIYTLGILNIPLILFLLLIKENMKVSESINQSLKEQAMNIFNWYQGDKFSLSDR